MAGSRSSSAMVIVGGGLAGGNAAVTLREEGHRGRIVLAARERATPFGRPPLSKTYLRGEESLKGWYVRPPEWYGKHDVDLLNGSAVAAIDPAAGEELVRISPDRALLVIEGSTAAARERLAGQGYRAYDMTAALAALEVEGEDLMRRLTELDLDALPAIGSIARGTPALIERRGGERFRLFVPQELGHFVAEVIVDLQHGLER